MAAREMRFSDDFRMRSTVVWLCFGIVVLCAIAGECDAKRRYSDVNYRQAGPVLRSVFPMFRYRNLDGQIVARPAKELREEDVEEEPEGYDEEPGGDEDEGDGPGEDFEGGEAGEIGEGDEDFGPNFGEEPFEDEEEQGEDDEEEEEDDEQDEDQEEEEDEVEDDPELRQAFINNQYVPRPTNTLKQGQRPLNNINNNNRVPLNNNNNNNNKPLVQRKPNNNVNNLRPNQQLNAPNRRNPNPGQNVLVNGQQNLAPNQNRFPQGVVAPINDNNMKGNNKQRLQLRPVATSTQFIATPVADLILRLSISIAKPNNARGAANVNVPIRIGPANTFFHDDVTGLKANQTENISPKSINVLSAPLALEMPSELVAENEKDNEKESTTAVPVTELPKN